MIYRDLHASIMRFCQDFKDSTGVTPATFVAFDATFEVGDLPDGELIGYMGLTFDIDDGMISGTFQIGYSTFDDINLFKLVNIMDQLLDVFKPSSKLSIYDADTGESQGYIVVRNGTRLMSVIGQKNRPIQFIAVPFVTTTTYEITGDVWESV